ncbi:hypothetical protein Y032_0087g2085 [Ancylostoma ceylanicum]|uniref:Uncharacterized protein n=1 Tax=Ancylostoma ceylanicum TaxID=53326 RepID=A0A016TPN5_9BILA|nr:hypothetical protein Y032_0087g2085 [Ancylostoma ceylanicum]
MVLNQGRLNVRTAIIAMCAYHNDKNSAEQSNARAASHILVEKVDCLRVRFHSVAAAESRRDLVVFLTRSMLPTHALSRSRRDSSATESVHLFGKCCTYRYSVFHRGT